MEGQQGTSQECQLELAPWPLHVPPSPTMAIKLVADKLKREGQKVFDFGVGEMNPEIPLPLLLRDAIISAHIDGSHSHYCPSSGDRSLLEALSDDFKHFGLIYTPDQIVICPGPKDAIYKTCVALLDPLAQRNRVVAFAPTYEAFENMPMMITGKPAIRVSTDDQLLPNLEELESVLNSDPTVAAVIINSPNNPAGVYYPPSLIKKLAEIIGKHPKVAIISDEVYRTIIYSDVDFEEDDNVTMKKKDKETIWKGRHISIATYLPQQTLVVGGISKELSGTGLRLGWVAGPTRIIRCIENVEGNSSACVNLPIQIALATFLRKDSDFSERNRIRRKLQKRRDLFMRLFYSLPPLKKCTNEKNVPNAAFYYFPNITGYLHTQVKEEGKEETTIIESDTDLALYLLREAKVVTIPGSSFLRAGHLRLAFARDRDTIVNGLTAMAGALAKLVPLPA